MQTNAKVTTAENVEAIDTNEVKTVNTWALRLNYGGKKPMTSIFEYSDDMTAEQVAIKLNNFIQYRAKMALEVREDAEGNPLTRIVKRKNKKTGEVTEHEAQVKQFKMSSLGVAKRSATLDILCNNEVLRSAMYGVPVFPNAIFENNGRFLHRLVKLSIEAGKDHLELNAGKFSFMGTIKG